MSNFEQIGSGEPQLDGAAIVSLLSSVNREAVIIPLGYLKVDEGVMIVDIARAIDENDGSRLYPLAQSHINVGLRRMPDDYVTVEKPPGKTKVEATMSKAGLYLPGALGGHLLDLAARTSVPLRVLVGEINNPEGTEGGNRKPNSVESRIRVLTTMKTLADKRWQSSTDLAGELEPQGVSNPAMRRHLTALREVGIVEERKHRRVKKDVGGGKRSDWRLSQSNGHVTGTEVVGQYFEILGKFHNLELEYVEEGIDHLHRRSHDRRYLPYLVKRSFYHSGRVKERKQSPSAED